jgi:hypothetical protein
MFAEVTKFAALSGCAAMAEVGNAPTLPAVKVAQVKFTCAQFPLASDVAAFSKVFEPLKIQAIAPSVPDTPTKPDLRI